MSCCGSRRQAYAALPPQRRLLRTPAAHEGRAPAVAPPLVTPPSPDVHFQYRGGSALKVQNPANGHRYEFAAPGAVVRADPADAAWLLSFPWLIRVG
jgi:hypothetical protein